MSRRLKITQRLIDELTRRNVHLLPGAGQSPRAGEWLVYERDTIWETDCQMVGPLVPRRFGSFSYSRSQLPGVFDVGRYCSLGKSMDFLLDRHPVDWASTSPFSYEAHDKLFAAYLRRQGIEATDVHPFTSAPDRVRIGHDVFIGNKVIIKSGLTIGNGAVVGGGSVVVKDVPPYAIVGGAPARLIRYRFSADIIERFERLRWWRFGPDKLAALNVPDPSAFLDGVERLIDEEATGAKVGRVTAAQLVEWCAETNPSTPET